MGDSAQEVVDMWSISDIDGAVILTGNFSLDLLAEPGVFFFFFFFFFFFAKAMYSYSGGDLCGTCNTT